MRWPIRLQLLVPILLVVVVAVTAVSLTGAWFAAAQARQQQEQNVRRLSGTIASATFPLTDSVLEQLSGLSGAQFVLLDGRDHVRSSTLPLSPADESLLFALPASLGREGFSENPVAVLSGRAYLAERLPVAEHRGTVPPGSLVVLYPKGRWWAAIRQSVYPVLAIGILAVAVVVVVTTLLAQRLIVRIRRLGNQTAAIAGGDFTPLPIGSGNDEIRDLAVSINQMTETLSQYENGVRQSERLRTLGQLGAGMAHQLRNSATGALMAIELHERECPVAAQEESLGVATRQLKLMESYLQRFLALGPSGPRADEEVSLEALVEDVLELVRPACVHAKIAVEFDRRQPSLAVRGDRQSLGQLLVNLVVNAIEAAGAIGEDAGPERRVVVELDKIGTDRAVVSVKDSGPGPAAATRGSLFEPFVTDKPDGTGLGLSVARQIAEAHQGTIRWQRVDATTCFTVELPLLHPRADDGAPVGNR